MCTNRPSPSVCDVIFSQISLWLNMSLSVLLFSCSFTLTQYAKSHHIVTPLFFPDFPWRILVSATSVVVFCALFIYLRGSLFANTMMWTIPPLRTDTEITFLTYNYLHWNTLTKIHHQFIKPRARLITWCPYSWLLSTFLIEFYNLEYCIQSFWFAIDCRYCHNYTERTQTQDTQADMSWCPEYEIQSPMSKIQKQTTKDKQRKIQAKKKIKQKYKLEDKLEDHHEQFRNTGC